MFGRPLDLGSSGIKFEVEGGEGSAGADTYIPLQKSFILASFFTEIAPVEKRAPAALFLIKQILWFCKDCYVASPRSSECIFFFTVRSARYFPEKILVKYF